MWISYDLIHHISMSPYQFLPTSTQMPRDHEKTLKDPVAHQFFSHFLDGSWRLDLVQSELLQVQHITAIFEPMDMY